MSYFLDYKAPYSYSLLQIRKLAVYSGFIRAILLNQTVCFSWNWLLQTLKQSNHITVNEADLAASDRAESIRVLHVDDDSSNLEISKQIMKDMDASLEFDCACCVDEAFEKLSTGQYDVVVSDYEMPQKDGLQFLSELRKQNNEIPFILFTGKGREDVAVKALNLGADSYINKNGSPETVYCELADAINKTLERKKSLKLLAASETKYRTLVENSLQGISILLAAPLTAGFYQRCYGENPELFSSRVNVTFARRNYEFGLSRG